MPQLESKFFLNDKVSFNIRNILFIGKIVGITFVERGTFYDIEVNGIIHKSVKEEDITKN